MEWGTAAVFDTPFRSPRAVRAGFFYTCTRASYDGHLIILFTPHQLHLSLFGPLQILTNLRGFTPKMDGSV